MPSCRFVGGQAGEGHQIKEDATARNGMLRHVTACCSMLQHVAECKLHVKRHVTARYVLQVGEEYQIEVEPGP